MVPQWKQAGRTQLKKCNVPKTKYKSNGDGAFAVVAPKLWTELPLNVGQAPSLVVFKSR